MNGDSGHDYPEERTAVDVRAASRDDVLLSFVEKVTDSELLLSVGQDKTQRRVRLEPAERLDLIWRGPEDLRSAPAELISVDGVGSDAPMWRVRLSGPAARGQRRAAVRAPLTVPISICVDNHKRAAVSVDVSEGGVRCVLDEDATAHTERLDTATGDVAHSSTVDKALEVGKVVAITVDLEEEQISCEAEVIRRHHRTDRRKEVSLRFIGLGEYREDTIRRYVFAGLRDLRARGLI
jgi:hypothetical protein